MDEQEMKEFFADAVAAIEKSVRPWRIATKILSLVVVVLAIIAAVK